VISQRRALLTLHQPQPLHPCRVVRNLRDTLTYSPTWHNTTRHSRPTLFYFPFLGLCCCCGRCCCGHLAVFQLVHLQHLHVHYVREAECEGCAGLEEAHDVCGAEGKVWHKGCDARVLTRVNHVRSCKMSPSSCSWRASRP